jgi:hypothetical protein
MPEISEQFVSLALLNEKGAHAAAQSGRAISHRQYNGVKRKQL